VRLWVLLVATEILDLLAFGFMAAGIERGAPDPSFPWSHGLFMSLVWSALAGALALLFYRDRRAGIVVGLMVFRHWVMDFISHSSDLPLLFGGSPLVGLGFESSLAFGIVMEFGLLTVGIAVYLAARKKEVNRWAGA
jgi:formate hydrogenlyase subunit 4